VLKHFQIDALNPREPFDRERISDAWALLRERIDEPTLQTDQNWFWPNMEYLSPPENKLHFILIADGNSPLALIPLERRRVSIGPVSFKALGFIYHPAALPDSAMLVDNQGATIWDDLSSYLSSLTNWHCLSLEGLTTTSTVALELVKRFKAHQRFLERSPTPQLYVPSTDDGKGYLRTHSSNLRKHLNRTRRKLEKLGTVEFVSGQAMHKKPLEILIDIDRQSWRMNKPDDVKKNQDLIDYIYRLNSTFDHKGAHIFRFLLVDGVPVASHYSFQYGNVQYAIKNAFDERFRSYGSPGLLMLNEVVMEAFDNDMVRVEFQAENWYATRFASNQHYLCKDLLFNSKGVGCIIGPILNHIKKFRDRIAKDSL